MLDQFRNTARHTLIYGIGNLSVKLVGFFLIPVYTSNLNLEEFGVIGVLEITAQLLVGIFSLRVPSALLRWGSDELNVDRSRSIYYTSLLMLLAGVMAMNILIWIFGPDISVVLFGPEGNTRLFTWLALAASLEILGLLPLQLLRLQERSTAFMGLMVARFSAILVFTIYFIIYRKMGVEGYLLGAVMGNALLWLMTLPFQYRHSLRMFLPDVARAMLKYGFPLIFSSVALLLLAAGDRYFLRYFHGFADLGIYTLAYKLGSVINVFIIGSFSLGFLPIAFKMSKQPGFGRFMALTTTWFYLFIVLFSAGLAMFSKELTLFLSRNNPAYWEAWYIVPVVLFIFILKGLQYVQATVFQVSRKTRYDAGILVVALVINLILNLLLVPAYNYYGCLVASAGAYLAMLVMTYSFGKKALPVPYENGRLIALTFLALVLFLFPYFLNDLPLIYRIPLKVVILTSLPVIMWVVGFFSSKEMEVMRKIRRYWRDPAFWKNAFS